MDRVDTMKRRFKAQRVKLGLTQLQLAGHLGVDRVTVARWETGTRRIPEMAARLLKLLREK